MTTGTCHIDFLVHDTLLEIFLTLMSHEGLRTRTRLTIMAVNRKWRRLIITNPLFWKHVDIGSSIYPSNISSFLYSGSTQIVDVTMDFDVLARNRISLQDACAQTMMHHSQIRSLEVLNLPDWEDMALFLQTWNQNQITSPVLKSISVSAKHRYPEDSIVILDVYPKYAHNWPGADNVESLTLSFINPFTLPVMRNLMYLEFSMSQRPVDVLPTIFSNAPLLETLVFHQYEEDDFGLEASPLPIHAQSLRYLGVGGFRPPLYDDFRDDFSYLRAPNLEGLDVLHSRWCANIRPFNRFPKLRRLRLHESNHGQSNVLVSLPSTVTLEISQMPETIHNLLDMFNLNNLGGIVYAFVDNLYGFRMRTDYAAIWNMARELRQEVRSPTVMYIPQGQEPGPDVLAILGANFTARAATKWETWLLKRYDNLYFGRDENSESFSGSD